MCSIGLPLTYSKNEIRYAFAAETKVWNTTAVFLLSDGRN